MFMGPLEAVKPWQTNQLAGVVRFRERVYSLVTGPMSSKPVEGDLLREMHKTIKKVTNDIEKMAFNTVISSLMIFLNTLNGLDSPPPGEAVETLVLLLSPFAPHIAEEAWEILGNFEHHRKCISLASWPKFDESLCVDTTAVVAIQVNGKMRGKVEMEKSLEESAAMQLAQEQPSVNKFMEGKQVKKVIYIPGKILNIVVA